MKKTVQLCSYKREASLIMEDAEEEALVRRERWMMEMKLGVSIYFYSFTQVFKKSNLQGKDEELHGRGRSSN